MSSYADGTDDNSGLFHTLLLPPKIVKNRHMKTLSLSSILEKISKEIMHTTFLSALTSKINILVTKFKKNKLKDTSEDEIAMIVNIQVNNHMHEKTWKNALQWQSFHNYKDGYDFDN